MKKPQRFRTIVLVFLLVGTSQSLYAQRAQINGRITDSSSAVIVGAKITVTDVDTGIKRPVTSNEEGYYTVGLLQQGNYLILVEMQGFKPIERSGIKLDIHQIARMDFVLEVGEV